MVFVVARDLKGFSMQIVTPSHCTEIINSASGNVFNIQQHNIFFGPGINTNKLNILTAQILL